MEKNEEIVKFPVKIRSGGKGVSIITIPKDYREYYKLNDGELIEVTIRKNKSLFWVNTPQPSHLCV